MAALSFTTLAAGAAAQVGCPNPPPVPGTPDFSLTPGSAEVAFGPIDARLFNAVRAANRRGLLFSLAPGSPTLTANGYTAADIPVQRRPGDDPVGVGLFATEGQLGLPPGDDMDGLTVPDPGHDLRITGPFDPIGF